MSPSHWSPPAPPRPVPHFVFFPRPLPSAPPLPSTSSSPSTSRYLYGWEQQGATVVAGAIEASTAADAQDTLEDATGQLLGTQRDKLAVVGKCVELVGCQKGKGKVRQRGSEPALELLISDAGVPSVANATSTIETTVATPTFILYTPPSRSNLQFLSLVPLQLDLNSFSLPATIAQRKHSEPSATRKMDEVELLGEKIRQAARLDFTSPSHRSLEEIADLDQVVACINLAPYLTSRFDPTSIPRRPLQILSSPIPPLLKHPIRLLRLVAHAIVLIANWQIPMLGGTALKDFSGTIQQIDTRLSQALSWPSQYSLIRQTLDHSVHAAEAPSLALGRAHYIQFYNTMWLIANDVIVGTAFTSFLCENSDYIGRTLGDLLQNYTLTSLRELLLWLNDWPGGVKLNFELATVFCDAFLWGTGLWEDLIFTPLRTHLPSLVYILGLTGLLGTTMFISFASDLLSLLTFHIFVFYFLATSIFRWHLSMLGSLFNIFRGRKFNVLRNRVEPTTYEVDQLLLGTILFTLAAFLFPTVLAYYLAFAASRLLSVVLHAAMETIVAFMNHFPLFAVMLRFKDPARLPGGIQFELVQGGGAEEAHVAPYLRMSNRPVELAGIFFQHLQLSRRLASHYSPIYLLGRLLQGRHIAPIPRVRLTLWVDATKGREGLDPAASAFPAPASVNAK